MSYFYMSISSYKCLSTPVADLTKYDDLGEWDSSALIDVALTCAVIVCGSYPE